MISCSIVEYYEMLKNHDWYYDMSDDHNVYLAGLESRRHLEAIAYEKGLDYARMYEAFNKSYFSGEPWGTQPVEIPRLNEYL